MGITVKVYESSVEINYFYPPVVQPLGGGPNSHFNLFDPPQGSWC
jgi:hypothetical protein